VLRPQVATTYTPSIRSRKVIVKCAKYGKPEEYHWCTPNTGHKLPRGEGTNSSSLLVSGHCPSVMHVQLMLPAPSCRDSCGASLGNHSVSDYCPRLTTQKRQRTSSPATSAIGDISSNLIAPSTWWRRVVETRQGVKNELPS
jgi:hypothetical protein